MKKRFLFFVDDVMISYKALNELLYKTTRDIYKSFKDLEVGKENTVKMLTKDKQSYLTVKAVRYA